MYFAAYGNFKEVAALQKEKKPYLCVCVCECCLSGKDELEQK